MSSVLSRPRRRLVTVGDLVHEVADWRSAGAEGVYTTLVCGMSYRKLSPRDGGVYWHTTNNETDPATCLWCIAGRVRIW